MELPMSREAASPLGTLTHVEQLDFARQVVRREAQALAQLADRLDHSLCQAASLLFEIQGSAIVTGMGKAGLVGQKIAATFASTGTRSHFLHPAEAVHGDLGRVHAGDVVLALSKSGETEELLRLLPSLARQQVPLIAITASKANSLAKAAHIVLELGPMQEACSLGLAPSTSTTAMLALGDALALVVSRMRGFAADDFYGLHPAGNLGRQLSRVEERMRPLDQCRLASDGDSVRQVFVDHGRPGRRAGAIMLTDARGRLTGIFTDSDLAKLFESRRDAALDAPIRQVMTARPCTVPAGAMMGDAVRIIAERKISELPVVDAAGRPLGMIDITDVVGMMPEGSAGKDAAAAPIKPPKMLRLLPRATRPASGS
jgi:arabinose-5-phosphate isomerase